MRIGFATDKGRSRASNQDAMLASAEYRCIAVADGLGGHNGGAEASNLAIGMLARRAGQITKSEELKQVLLEANSAIRLQAEEDPRLQGMGTTMTAGVVRSGKAIFAHVGDSRAYLVRSDKAEMLTTDHSIAGQLVQGGYLKQEDISSHPGRHAVIRCLGAEDELEPQMIDFPLEVRDVIILCTDGFWEQVNEVEIAERFAGSDDLMTVCEDLVRLANLRSGSDNITVAAALIEESDVR